MEFEDVWQRKNKSKRERSSYIKPTAQASRLTKKSSSKGTVQHPCDLEKFEKTTLLQNIILQSSLPNWGKLAIGCLADWAAIWKTKFNQNGSFCLAQPVYTLHLSFWEVFNQLLLLFKTKSMLRLCDFSWRPGDFPSQMSWIDETWICIMSPEMGLLK